MGIIQAHANAYLALLRGKPNLIVYPLPDGDDPGQRVPSGAQPPYVVVDVAVETLGGSTLVSASDTVIAYAYCHCAGGNDGACRAVVDLVRAALLDVRPVIAGRSVGLIRHDSNRPPVPDASTGTLLVEQTDVYKFTTYPG